jgi:urease accessory protein
MAMDAELELEFLRRGCMTECRLVQQDPPWKVVRGFERPDGECLVHLGNVSGGIFGGDHLRLRARVESGAQAMVTTSGATRIYRPRETAPEAMLACEFAVGREALLEYLPDPLIPFAGARLLQTTAFSLEDGAVLLAWDVIAPGRAAAGELFQYKRMKLATEIRVCGKPILQDRLLFEPSRFGPSAPAALGGYRYMVTFLVVRAGANSVEMRQLEGQMAELAEGLRSAEDNPDELWAATTLSTHGVLVRGALHSPLRIPHRLQALWSAVRQEICGRTADPPRKTY